MAPTDALNALKHQEVILRVAPNFDDANMLIRFGRIKPPNAAQDPSRNSYLFIAEAKKEPSFVTRTDAFNALKNQEVIPRVAPNFDVANMLIRFGRIKPPNAAQDPSRNSYLSIAEAKKEPSFVTPTDAFNSL